MINKSETVQFHHIECNTECKISPKLLISVVTKETLQIIIFLYSTPFPLSIIQHLLPSGSLKNVSKVLNILAFCKTLSYPDTGQSKSFQVGVGLRQGSVFSPLLFIIYMNWNGQSQPNRRVCHDRKMQN